jgi:microcystin-dependent protein
MGYTNFVNGSTPLNDTTLNAMQKGLMQLVFPIGSTYTTQNNTNPNTILGFGTWERLKGKVCLGLDENDTNMNAIRKTGGEKTHTLTIQEMPNHAHNIRYWQKGARDDSGTGKYLGDGTSDPVNAGGSQSGGTIQPVGSGQPHNNMQPYEIVGFMWIRRS